MATGELENHTFEKVGVGLGQEGKAGGCLCVVGGNYLKYLKKGWGNRKKGTENKCFKNG